MLWDVVKVKIQCPSGTLVGGTTHTYDINLDDLKDARGDSSLMALQQAILKLVVGPDDNLELQLSLSYLNHEGDLIPLTVQNEWDKALMEHSKTQQSATKKALLVLAQVMQPMGGHNHQGTIQESLEEERAVTPTNNNSNSNSNSNVEERLARMEELLVAFTTSSTAAASMHHNNNNNKSNTAGTPASIPHTPSRDYTSIVKDHQASLTTRLNKVKQMNATVSAATTPDRSIPNSPAKIHRLAGTGSTETNSSSLPDAGAPWVPPLDRTTTSAPTNSGPDPLQLQEFLERMIQERQEGMHQLMESRNLELQAWQQAQSSIQLDIQKALDQNKTVVETELETQKTELLAQVQSKLEKLEQHRLVAQARDSVAMADALTKATQQMQQTLQEQMQQIAASTLSSSSTTTTTAPPPPPPVDPSVYLSALESKLEQRMDTLEQMIQQASATSARTNALVAAIPPPTSSSTSTAAPPVSPSKNANNVHNDTTKLQLDLLQQQLETSLMQKFEALEQRLQTHHLQQLNVMTDASVSNSLDADILQGMEANLMQAIVSNAANIINAAASPKSSSATTTTTTATIDPALLEEWTCKLTDAIQSSQDVILHNEKQYASALRQTMIRLHKETQDNVVASMTKTLTKKLKHAAKHSNETNNNSSSSISPNAVDWDHVKDDVHKSQAESLNQHKKELVECIQGTQLAILSQLAKDSGDKHRERTLTSPTMESSTAAAAQDAVTMEQMEDLILGAMEKLEATVGTNTEAIQAQATAVILDHVKSSQAVVVQQVTKCQDALQDQMEASQAQVLDAIQAMPSPAAPSQPAYVQSQHLFGVPETQPPRPPLTQRSLPPQPPAQVQPPMINQPPQLAAAASRLERLLGSGPLPAELAPPPKPVTSGRPRADGTTVKRFLDMETRSYRLEAAYDCIKHNKDLKTALTAEQEAAAAKTNAATLPSAAGQHYEKKKEELHDLPYPGGNPVSIQATYQVKGLGGGGGAFPSSKGVGVAGSVGTGSGDWI